MITQFKDDLIKYFKLWFGFCASTWIRKMEKDRLVICKWLIQIKLKQSCKNCQCLDASRGYLVLKVTVPPTAPLVNFYKREMPETLNRFVGKVGKKWPSLCEKNLIRPIKVKFCHLVVPIVSSKGPRLIILVVPYPKASYVTRVVRTRHRL